MRAYKSVILLLITFYFNVGYSQQLPLKKFHPLSGKIGISLEGGSTFTRSDFNNSEFDLIGRLMLEYNFVTTKAGSWGLRAIGSGGYLSGSGGASSQYPELQNFKTDLLTLGGGINYTLAVSNHFFPFAAASISYLYYSPKDNNGNMLPRNEMKSYSRHEYMISGELGFKILVTKNLTINFSSAVNYVDSDNLDDITAGSDNDIYFTAFGGLTVYFGGTKDSDRDGVNDENDLCPDSPFGVIVDRSGCPVDTDNDGVPDYLDQCPNTPANIPIDIDGCPVDSDGDGIPDYLDLCKDTPENVMVDKRGCPIDEDGDGVPDYRDDCLGTTPETEVDLNGCPLFSQQKRLPEVTSLVLSGAVNFEVGKSELLTPAMLQLDKLAEVIIDHPETIWKIEGHTDNTGSYSLNKKLSYQRANSVATYLVQKGVKGARLEIGGSGPDSPVADNSTETGRSINRRVVIELVGDLNQRFDQNISDSKEYNIYTERNVGNMIFTDGYSFLYQVASFKTINRAESEANRLRSFGFNAFIIETNSPELDGTWYRVRVGYFKSLLEAQINKAKLSEQ